MSAFTITNLRFYNEEQLIEAINKAPVITDADLVEIMKKYCGYSSPDDEVLEALFKKNKNVPDYLLDKLVDLIEYAGNKKQYVCIKVLLDSNVHFSNEHYKKLFSRCYTKIINMAVEGLVAPNAHCVAEMLNNNFTNYKNPELTNDKIKLLITKHKITVKDLVQSCIMSLFGTTGDNKDIVCGQMIDFILTIYNIFEKEYQFTEVVFVNDFELILHAISSTVYFINVPITCYVEKITEFLTFFKKNGLKINQSLFLKILYAERNMERIRQKDIYKKLYVILFSKKLFDFQIANADIVSFLQFINKKRKPYGEDFISQMLKYNSIPKLQQLFEIACKFNNSNLYIYAKTGFQVSYSKTCFNFVCNNSNKTMLLDFLENKIVPSSDDIINICSGNQTIKEKEDVIDLIISYGMPIIDETYEIIRLAGIKLKTDIVGISATKVTRLDNYSRSTHLSIPSTDRKKYEDVAASKFAGDAMYHLRNLYLICEFDKIAYFEEKYEVEPDVLCFENALLNKDQSVMNYVFDNYNYKPNILAITRIKEDDKRMMLLIKFYPELCKIDYVTGVTSEFKVIKDIINEDATELDNNTPLEQNEDLDKPIKKKTVVKSKKTLQKIENDQNSTDSQNDNDTTNTSDDKIVIKKEKKPTKSKKIIKNVDIEDNL